MASLEPRVQELEHPDDVGCLVQGDAVRFRVDLLGRAPTEFNGLAVYRGMNEGGRHQFICPREWGQAEYVGVYSVFPHKVGVEDGKIILREDHFSSQSYTVQDKEYSRMNELLFLSGVRKQ